TERSYGCGRYRNRICYLVCNAASFLRDGGYRLAAGRPPAAQQAVFYTVLLLPDELRCYCRNISLLEGKSGRSLGKIKAENGITLTVFHKKQGCDHLNYSGRHLGGDLSWLNSSYGNGNGISSSRLYRNDAGADGCPATQVHV